MSKTAKIIWMIAGVLTLFLNHFCAGFIHKLIEGSNNNHYALTLVLTMLELAVLTYVYEGGTREAVKENS